MKGWSGVRVDRGGRGGSAHRVPVKDVSREPQLRLERCVGHRVAGFAGQGDLAVAGHLVGPHVAADAAGRAVAPADRDRDDEPAAVARLGRPPGGRTDDVRVQFGDTLEPDTKLMCSWLVGDRDTESANDLMADLASRLRNRVQITTDGHRPYIEAIERAFGRDVDYAMLIKQYGQDPNEERRFSPPVVLAETVRVVKGNPDPERISTSYVERQNLTMRMGMRRFTRLTNGFSKKLQNHAAAVLLRFFYMNWGRPHKSLAKPYPRTPAMAAGLADHIWTCEEIAALLD